MLLRSLLASCISTAGVAVALLLPLPLVAQLPAPTKVTVVADGAAAVVTWAPVRDEGVVYRVTRALDERGEGTDITDPVTGTKVYDSKIEAGVTYFYQVIAVYRDATTAAAPFVSFTAPAATPAPAPLAIVTQPALGTATAVLPPSAVTGVTAEGSTTASVLISWQPVTGASSYSVKRSWNGTSATPVTGLTATSWTDRGPTSIGFPIAADYMYEVTAATPFGNVSGQTTWARPKPSCAEPPASQQPLTVLDPNKNARALAWPNGLGVIWDFGWALPRPGIIAIRLDRSVSGSGIWSQVGLSCDGTIPADGRYVGIFDTIKGITANITYLYKLTSFAANGDVGIGTIPFTMPNPSVMHWLAATSVGSTVTLNFRYERPATNPPANPGFRGIVVTAPYGLNKTISTEDSCTSLAGCTLVVTGVPSGTQVFTVSAQWKDGTRVVASVSATTTVIVP